MKKRLRRRVTPGKIVSYIVLIFWAVTTVYPFFWVILNSFREKGLIRSEGKEYVVQDGDIILFRFNV